MTRTRSLLLAAALAATAACAGSPTESLAPGGARFDGGHTMGGGHRDGGQTMGGGHRAGTAGSTTAAAPGEATAADSAATVERGGQTMGGGY